jgi:peptidoglycan/xylan/chitin deacetylase (PgdA/CDA1 family)
MATPGIFGVRRVVIAMAIIAVALPWEFAHGDTGVMPRRQMRHAIFYRVRTDRPMVALTFDDGPDARYTPRILAILKQTDAHATFFVLGHRVLEHPDLVGLIASSGNELGNHTQSHPHLTWLLGKQQRSEITGGANALEELGYHPVWFRPPYGLVSSMGVADALSLGERTVLWSMALDHEYRVHHGACVGAMLRNVRRGDIILAHDARPKTFDSLRRLLDGLRERGFQVVTVSELVAASPVF